MSLSSVPNHSFFSAVVRRVPTHRIFAIEYFDRDHPINSSGRGYKKPDDEDLARVERATARYNKMKTRFVPTDRIPNGDETRRLIRWGYKHYRQLFNPRQLLSLELSGRLIRKVPDPAVRNALATNLSDILRYQCMLARYDTTALKVQDIFALHGFRVGLIQAESNPIGLLDRWGNPAGSGGWHNAVEKYSRAIKYCEDPFETRVRLGKAKAITTGEWIGVERKGSKSRTVTLCCASATRTRWKPNSLSAVFTDPPYYDNLQYAELSDFFFVWLRRLIGMQSPGFDRPSCRSSDDLTGTESENRGLHHFTEGLSAAFRNVAHALRPGAPLVFTFHHLRPKVYHAVAVALLDSGLACTATFPCPSEAGASLHIRGRNVAMVDTVFVARKVISPSASAGELATQAVKMDCATLRKAGFNPRPADERCLLLGHLTRISAQRLRGNWNRRYSVNRRLAQVADSFRELMAETQVSPNRRESKTF